MSTVELVLVIFFALAGGLGLTGLGILIELSTRKARPYPAAPPKAPQPEVTRVPPEVAAPGREALAPQAPEPEPPPAVEAEPPVVETPPPPVATEPAPPPVTIEPPPKPLPISGRARMALGLRRTREAFLSRIRGVISGGAQLDDICEGLEEALIGADVGVDASGKLVAAVRSQIKKNGSFEAVRDALKHEISAMLKAVERPLTVPEQGPLVVMMVGVNGVGKTTTLAKLAARMKDEHGSVLVAAADTFRAAAIEQLETWCQRVGVEIIKQKQGSDPAAVAFDAVKAAKARSARAVLIDTAGRLQTKTNLMEELKKIARVVDRELPGAPHETWLVLDANTGQNALSQAKIFNEAVKLSGVVLAKLDSSAKGGVIVAVTQQLKLPIRFVGVGEELEDLRPFDPEEFTEALLAGEDRAEQAASGPYAA